MRTFTVQNKLITLFALPIIALILLVYISVTLSASIQSNFTYVADNSLPIVAAVEHMKFAGSRLLASSNELVLDNLIGEEDDEVEEGENDDSEIEEINEAIEEFNISFEEYRQLLLIAVETGRVNNHPVDEIETHGQELVNIVETLVELQSNEDSFDEITEQRLALEAAEDPFIDSLDITLKLVRDDLEIAKSDVATSASNFVNSVVLVVIVTISLISGLGYYILRSILVPLVNLRDTAEQIRKGDLSARSIVSSQDELGQVASAFNSMSEAVEYRDQLQIEQLAITAEAQQKAETANRVKSSFLASMSHELRTPLNSIINFSKFISKGVMGSVNDEQKETLDEIVMSGEHLLSLINDVLDISKIESDSLHLFIEDNIAIDELLETAVATANSLIKDKPVEIQTEIHDDLPAMRADRQRILQILLNILSNACKFTDEGYIKIVAQQQAGDIVISIRDTGAGIAANDFDQVFENFGQTESGLRAGSGTGLGMPISKSLVEAHDGKLWFESEVNLGTTFYILLPVKSEQLVPTI